MHLYVAIAQDRLDAYGPQIKSEITRVHPDVTIHIVQGKHVGGKTESEGVVWLTQPSFRGVTTDGSVAHCRACGWIGSGKFIGSLTASFSFA